MGLLVMLMIGLIINLNIGDYLCGVIGFWVENGEIVYLVNECMIVGNFKDMMKIIIFVNDVCLYLFSVVLSLCVEGLIFVGN